MVCVRGARFSFSSGLLAFCRRLFYLKFSPVSWEKKLWQLEEKLSRKNARSKRQ